MVPGKRRVVDAVKAGVYRDLLVFDVTRAEWLVARDEWRSRQQFPAAPPPPA